MTAKKQFWNIIFSWQARSCIMTYNIVDPNAHQLQLLLNVSTKKTFLKKKQHM